MSTSGFLDWDSPDWESLSWDNGWTGPLPAVEQRPWYGNLRLLGTVVGVASVTLVASTVVLLTLNSPGDFPTSPSVAKLTPTVASSRMATPPPAPVTRPEASTPASEAPIEMVEPGVIGAQPTPAKSTPAVASPAIYPEAPASQHPYNGGIIGAEPQHPPTGHANH